MDYSWLTDYVPPADLNEIASETLNNKGIMDKTTKTTKTTYEDDEQLEKLNEQLAKKNSYLTLDKIKKGFENDKVDYSKKNDTNANTRVPGAGNSIYTETTYYVVNWPNSNINGTYKLVEKHNGSKTTVTVSYSTSTSKSYGESDDGEGIHSLSYELQNIVANWYYRILIIALVGMMSVLVYMGIRILLSSTASDKAKYKQMLGDWVIGMVILFMMHYGMVFANKIADKITTMLGNVNPNFYVQAIEDPDGKIEEAMGEDGAKFDIVPGDSSDAGFSDRTIIKADVTTPDTDGGTETKHYLYFSTNLMGKLRYDVQANKSNSSAYIGYTVLFVIMVIYLFIFSFTYMKRVVYMAFLTIIAPLVALTYPIDKVNDGQAQGFNYWFKEYTFNLLLQPLHLLLYTVLISSAIELASENMIYAIVAMGFMVPAEKILRQMFNFGKANTPGVFGGAAGAAMVMGGLKWIAGRGPKGGGSSSGGGNSSSGGSGDSGKKIGGTDRFKMSGVPGTDGATIGTEAIGAGEKNNSNNRKVDSSGNLGRNNKNNLSGVRGKLYRAKNNIPKPVRTIAGKAGYYAKKTKDAIKEKGNEIKSSKAMKRLRVGAYMYKDGMAKKFKRNLAEGRPIKRMARIAVGAPIAAAGALIGTAAGAASGDAGNAVKYGVGAGAALYSLRKYGDTASDFLTIDGINEEMDRAADGSEEYERKQALKRQKEMAEDPNNISTYAQEMKVSRDYRVADKRNEEMVSFFGDNDFKTYADMIKAEKVAKKKYSDQFNSEKKEERNEARAKAAFGRQLKKEFIDEGKISFEPEKEEEVRATIKKVKNLNDAQADQAMILLKNWIDATR